VVELQQFLGFLGESFGCCTFAIGATADDVASNYLVNHLSWEHLVGRHSAAAWRLTNVFRLPLCTTESAAVSGVRLSLLQLVIDQQF
jgi:hypothetical protein